MSSRRDRFIGYSKYHRGRPRVLYFHLRLPHFLFQNIRPPLKAGCSADTPTQRARSSQARCPTPARSRRYLRVSPRYLRFSSARICDAVGMVFVVPIHRSAIIEFRSAKDPTDPRVLEWSISMLTGLQRFLSRRAQASAPAASRIVGRVISVSKLRLGSDHANLQHHSSMLA